MLAQYNGNMCGSQADHRHDVPIDWRTMEKSLRVVDNKANQQDSSIKDGDDCWSLTSERMLTRPCSMVLVHYINAQSFS
jgi:hypothetical protein